MIEPCRDRPRKDRAALSALSRAMRRLRRARTLFVVALIGATLTTPVAALSAETWVTAFVRFVEWQQPPSDATIVVCQPLDTPELDLAGKQVRGVTLLVMRVARPRDVSRCNVFVAWPQPGKPSIDWNAWLAAIGESPVLSIGLGERFCEIGGAVCITNDDAAGRENYRVNLDVLARAGFKVNAQLLRKQFPRQTKNE